MHTLKPLMIGFCLAAATGAAVAAPDSSPARRAVAAWPVVPDTVLGRMRGGIDLSNLVAYFAIERIVEVDGEVVARAEIVISNLDRLASGGLPTISVSGPLAQVVQIMNGGGLPGAPLASSDPPPASAGAAAPVISSAVPATSSAAPAPAQIASSAPLSNPEMPAAPAHGTAAPSSSVAPQTNGTISSGGTRSGSMAQFGSALSSAVAVAASATSATGAGNATAEAPSASAASLASAQPVVQPDTSAANAPAGAAASPATPASTPASAANAAATIPAPIIVVSNLPNATAITTAVQNEVRATTIQTQTTISATLNSLPVVNSIALASAIQAQVASAVGR